MKKNGRIASEPVSILSDRCASHMKKLFGKEKLLLIDGNYLLHRMLRNPRLQAMATKKKIPTGGVFGFLRSLRSTVMKLQGVDKVIVAFDGGNSERRKKLFPGYRVRPPINDIIIPGEGMVKKGVETTEEGMPYYELFGHQKRYVRDWVKAMGYPTVRFDNKEADDIIYRLATMREGTRVGDKYNSIIISDDKDFLQLLSDTVHVYRPIADEYFDPSTFKKEWGFPPKKYLLYKALVGDASDMVPGIKGIGDVYATEITNSVRKPREVIAYCKEHKRKNIKAVATKENLRALKRNLKLFDMRKEDFTHKEISEMERCLTSLPGKVDWGTLRRIASELELESLAENLGKWMRPFRG